MWVDKITTEKVDLTIKGATLLSTEEVEKLPMRLSRYSCSWWLRSPGCDGRSATFVYSASSVYYIGYDVYFDFITVRPALIIELGDNLKIGDYFIFDEKEFEIISNSLAFCKTDIGNHRFDQYTNNYETSEIKRYVDEWFETAKVE